MSPIEPSSGQLKKNLNWKQSGWEIYLVEASLKLSDTFGWNMVMRFRLLIKICSTWLGQCLPGSSNPFHALGIITPGRSVSEQKCEILARRCNFQCRPARFEMREIPRMREAGKNMCPEAESEGVGFLHGNSQVVKWNDVQQTFWCSRHSPMDETPSAKALMVMQYLELCFSSGWNRYTI